jgi:hypothetical protein
MKYIRHCCCLSHEYETSDTKATRQVGIFFLVLTLLSLLSYVVWWTTWHPDGNSLFDMHPSGNSTGWSDEECKQREPHLFPAFVWFFISLLFMIFIEYRYKPPSLALYQREGSYMLFVSLSDLFYFIVNVDLFYYHGHTYYKECRAWDPAKSLALSFALTIILGLFMFLALFIFVWPRKSTLDIEIK